MAIKIKKDGKWVDVIDKSNDCPFPVGSIYLSVGSTDPSTYWTGTTWSKVSDGYFMRASSTGGLTASAQSLPTHSHNLGSNGVAQISISYNTSWGNFICYNLSSIYSTTQWYMKGTLSYTSGVTSVQMPPLAGRTETATGNISGTLKPASVDVVMWYRTA